MHNRLEVFIQGQSGLGAFDFACLDKFVHSHTANKQGKSRQVPGILSNTCSGKFSVGDLQRATTSKGLINELSDLSEHEPKPRFSLFDTIDERTKHAPDIATLLDGGSAAATFNNGNLTWWLDCTNPTDIELQVLSMTFGIHPLTTEDILTQEKREKFELFEKYYFVSFHTFESDPECQDLLLPAHFYMVVFPHGILTFHKDMVAHPVNVRRRIRQLKKYFQVDPNWICYALIDNIIDSFEPHINRVEFEVDAIEDFVFVDCEYDSKVMFLHIAEAREKVTTLTSLLSEKTRIVHDFSRYCLDHLAYSDHSRTSASSAHPGGVIDVSGELIAAEDQMSMCKSQQLHADIAMYLGDIEDHIVTMSRNLKFYEEVLSRSSCNYLAQLQTHKRNLTNRVALLMQIVTVLGTMFFPMQFATGLWSMNVEIPGLDGGPTGRPYTWFFGIMGLCFFFLIVTFATAKILFKRGLKKSKASSENKLTKRSFKYNKSQGNARSVLSYRTSD